MTRYKGYYIKKSSVPRSFNIVTEGQGGRIPNVMRGEFTSVGVAKNLIDNYLDKRARLKEKSNASKATTKSGD